ncbi:MAG: ABC transporter substrate-binding protein [Actinomycetota bacterium]
MISLPNISRPLCALLLAAILLAACGGEDGAGDADSTASEPAATDEDTASPETTPDAEADDGAGDGDDDEADTAEPVVIEHRYGSTTIEGRPERIVSLDLQWTDVLLALDLPMVASSGDPLAEGGVSPWQADLLDPDTEILNTSFGLDLPLEQIAALQPDLIVITFAAQTEETYDTLSAIAPTIGPLTDDQIEDWRSLATAAGEIFDLEDEAAALIDEADAEIAALRQELPGLDGQDYSLANYVPGDSLVIVADPDDGAGQLFAQLGMSIDPEILDEAEGATLGRVQLSLERVDLLDSDLLMLLTNGVDPAEITGYDELPAVQRGSAVVLDISTAVALNTPSPLSVPYALERIRPALEAAAVEG